MDDRIVRTERLLLRPVVPADTDAVFAIHSDPRTNAHNPAGPMASRDAAERNIRDWMADWSDSGVGYWAVELLGGGAGGEGDGDEESGAVIGFGGIRPSTWREQPIYNLYYRFAPSAWGHGYATEVADAAVVQWKAQGDGVPLMARTTADNVPSQKTALRAGLVRRADLDEVINGVSEVFFTLGDYRV